LPCCSLITIFRFSLSAALLLAAIACGVDAPKFRSTDITGVEYGKVLELFDHTGTPRKLEDFRGKAVVVFFGFTHCPDVCPTTLADTAHAVRSLGRDAERVQVLMVTVDPERDTPKILGDYVTAFDPSFLGLHGELAATQRVAKDFKIYFEKRKAGDTYSVDHSGQSYVIDPRGRLRLLVRPERIGADLAADLRTVLAEP
jgi:protein SCO1